MLLLYRGERFDPNFYFHAKADIDHSFFLSEGERRMLLVPRMNELQARSLFDGKVMVYKDPLKTLRALVGRRKVGYDPASMSALLAQRLAGICKLEDRSHDLALMRLRKGPKEIPLLKKAAWHARQIMISLDPRSFRTEIELKKRILIDILERGLEPSFEPIVASGQKSAMPHHRPGNRKLSSPVLVDMGVRYKGHCSDITRCFITDSDKRKLEGYEALQGLFGTLLDRMPDCEDGGGLSSMARREVAKAGLRPMIHSIGHGIGLEVHERPYLREGSKDPLSGATMALEPAFYGSRYGMRYEEMVYFDGRRARLL